MAFAVKVKAIGQCCSAIQPRESVRYLPKKRIINGRGGRKLEFASRDVY